MFHKPPLPPRYILTTFGCLELRLDTGITIEHVRPRGLAMLAVVAASGKHGLPRAHALAVFWPEATDAHARNSLRQLLFHLRSTIGADLFTREQRALRLNPLRISTDVQQFEASLAKGMLADACARYDGPFLDGFDLPDHEEFSMFVERRRHDLELRHRDGLRALARHAEHAAEFGIAAEWWRALAAADPVDPVAAVHLATALQRTGRITEAYATLQVHATRLAKELGVEPTQTVRALMRELGGRIPWSVVTDEQR
jgi:DNA-binding SARP family transcriptional activator